MKRMNRQDLRSNKGLLARQLFSPLPVGGDKGEGETHGFHHHFHPHLYPPLAGYPPPSRGRGLWGGRTGSGSVSATAGFTLIEVLVAIVILTFGLLAVGSMQISAIRGNFMGGNTSIALSLASEKMEQLLNADYNSTDTNTDLRDSVTGNNTNLSSITSVDHQETLSEEGVVGANAFYRRIWNIGDQTSPITKNVMVIVTWQNNKHRVSIASIKRQ
jgi:type IV pilus modification protein PilV